jgi:hypothetical protein
MKSKLREEELVMRSFCRLRLVGLMAVGVGMVAVSFFGGVGCSSEGRGSLNQDDYYEGVAYDEENPYGTVSGGKEDGLSDAYDVPTDLPELEAPEIIISLDQLTLHLFDRETGFSEVYPVGVGVLNSDGVSITPTGHFETGPDTSDWWWYIPRRTAPEYFGGFPFIRLTIENSRGQNTYGIHGPITETLIRGYVSHGCMRMRGEDVVRVFYLIRDHASTPVTIQREVELDAAGEVVDVTTEVTLWEVGEEIAYGESVGDAPPRDNTGTDEDGCADDRFESAEPVPLEAGTYEGLVLCALDTDVYSVYLEAGQSMTATIEFVHEVADIDMLVAAPDETVLDRSMSITDQEVVSVTAEESGEYLISVYPYEGEDSGYTLTLQM